MACNDNYCTCENECDPCFGLTSSNQTIGVEFKPCCCLYDLTEVPQLLTFSTVTRELTITRGNTVVIPAGAPENPMVLIGSDDSDDIEFNVTDAMGTTLPGFENAFTTTHNFDPIAIPFDAPTGYKWAVEIFMSSGSSQAEGSLEYDVPRVRALRHRLTISGNSSGISTPGSNFAGGTQYAPTGLSVAQGINVLASCIWDDIPQTAAATFTPIATLWYALRDDDTEVNGPTRLQTVRSLIQWKLYLVAV
jgi:hypothetical protein